MNSHALRSRASDFSFASFAALVSPVTLAPCRRIGVGVAFRGLCRL
jgi:hypothetical protein